MEHKIDDINKTEYPNVVALWEASVRATHHFLKEEDIAYFKPLILNEYLDAKNLEVKKVDVNEQNEQALGFYEHHGFKTIGRSELDASGKPYPILHMALKK